jgi:hypothetical protein
MELGGAFLKGVQSLDRLDVLKSIGDVPDIISRSLRTSDVRSRLHSWELAEAMSWKKCYGLQNLAHRICDLAEVVLFYKNYLVRCEEGENHTPH